MTFRIDFKQVCDNINGYRPVFNSNLLLTYANKNDFCSLPTGDVSTECSDAPIGLLMPQSPANFQAT